MEIQRPSAVLKPLFELKGLTRLLSELRLGSTLDAVVETKLSENNVILKLAGGQLLRAQTQLVLEPGQTLKLEIVKGGAVPELRVVLTEQAVAPEAFAIQQALRQFLPKQQSLNDIAATLQHISAAQTGTPTRLPEPLSSTIREILGTLLSRDELSSAEGLKRGVNNSGIFLEAKLQNLPVLLPGDLKSHLLTLLDTLQKLQLSLPISTITAETAATLAKPSTGSPEIANKALDTAALNLAIENPETTKILLNKTESALARIVLDQLASLPQNDSRQCVWQLEIPFTDGDHTDAAKLKINRERKTRQGIDQDRWSVELELNPPGLGTVHSRITLTGESIDTYFWSDQENTTHLIRDHLDLLSARYSQAGLEVGQLSASQGGAPTGEKPYALLPKLLDERV